MATKKFKPAKAPKYQRSECNGTIKVKNLKTGKTQSRKKKSK